MYMTVYVDIETFKGLVCQGRDFDAAITPGVQEDIQLSVPFSAIQVTDDSDIVSVSRERILRYENR